MSKCHHGPEGERKLGTCLKYMHQPGIDTPVLLRDYQIVFLLNKLKGEEFGATLVSQKVSNIVFESTIGLASTSRAHLCHHLT